MSQYVDALSQALFARAMELSWLVAENPPELNATDFAFMVNEGETGVADMNKQQFYRRSAHVGDYSVIIADLGLDPEVADQHLSEHHYQAARARSFLSGRKENLLMILVGRLTSTQSHDRWVDVAYQIERDERVCRKMVFVTAANGGDLIHEMDRFMQRTFLARPWGAAEGPTDLMPLRTTLRDGDAPPAWIEILEGQLAGERLVDALIAALPEQES